MPSEQESLLKSIYFIYCKKRFQLTEINNILKKKDETINLLREQYLLKTSLNIRGWKGEKTGYFYVKKYHRICKKFSGLFTFFNTICIIKQEAFAVEFSMLAHGMPLTRRTTGAVVETGTKSWLLSSLERLLDTSQTNPIISRSF